MNTIRYLLVVLILSASASTADAFVLRTRALSDSSACCLPNGQVIAAGSFSFIVTLRDVEEEFFGLNLAYNFQANDDCQFQGRDLNLPRTQRELITEASGAVITTITTIPLECPTNVRARSVARFSTATERDTSVCQRPCPDCVPFDEGW